MPRDNFAIYRDVLPAKLKRKMPHCIRKGQNGFKNRTGFCMDEGDVPVAVLKEGGQLMAVDNSRGNAYAHRNALRYRQTKQQKLAAQNKKDASRVL